MLELFNILMLTFTSIVGGWFISIIVQGFIKYFLNKLLIEGVRIAKKEKEDIETLKNEKKFIEDVLKVCDKFNIDCTTVKLKDFKEKDFNAVNLLLGVKEYNGLINGTRNVEYAIVSFLKYKIALLKTIFDNDVIYYV